jgi:CheY-like chemotaxis protein
VGSIRLTLSVAAATSPPRAAKFALAGSLPGEDDRLTLVFEVQDTGPGIALEKIQHIFDSFTQADISTTRRFGGTGLGLTICRQLVEVMNGQIDVESAPDRGAVFRVTLAGVRPVSLDTPCLPLSPVSSLTTRKAAHLLPPGDRAASRQKVRILLAEDNDVNARLIETMMTRMGFEVTAVPTGAEALEELAQRSYDIILMDMHMPKMDGVEATQKIRALPGKQARIPIVALTADAITANRESYENIGLTAFLTKPIDWSLLEETLHAVARQASGQQVDRGSDQGLDPAATPGGPPADGKKPAGLPLVDETYLLDMIEVLGRENLDELLTNAQRSLEEALAACEAAVLAADLTAQREVLHRIKGLSGTLGGRRLSGLAGQGEEALRQAQALPFPAASVRLLVRATNARLAQFQKKYFRAPQADPLSERPPAQ